MFSRRDALAVSTADALAATAVEAACSGLDVGNTGDADLRFIGVVRTPVDEEISLSNRLVHTPAILVARHLNVDPATIARWPCNRALGRRPPGTEAVQKHRIRH